MPAPVVLFAFNRPDALKASLEALAANELASDTPLYIRLDGPRNEADAEKVAAVREEALAARGFLRVEVLCSEVNRGLSESVISGIQNVLDIYESVIVLEDDLVTHPGFLSFMNAGLELYRDVPGVFSVCGYTSEVRMPSGYGYDAYFCPRSSSWGWATWRDRWQSVDWNPTRASLRKNAGAFNRWGGADCAKMLRDWMDGKRQTWAIRFCYSQFLQGKVSLFPLRSLIDPSGGFDGGGTNCRKYSRFKFDFQKEPKQSFHLPERTEVVPSLRRSALRYHSLGRRAWSRLMYLVYG